jgi:hypothetical protein
MACFPIAKIGCEPLADLGGFERHPCKPSVLAADSDEEAVSKTISPSALNIRDEAPFKLVNTQTFNMIAPISIGDLPIGSECKKTHEGASHPRKYNAGYVLGCPDLILIDGSAGRDFDNYCADNDGSAHIGFIAANDRRQHHRRVKL